MGGQSGAPQAEGGDQSRVQQAEGAYSQAADNLAMAREGGDRDTRLQAARETGEARREVKRAKRAEFFDKVKQGFAKAKDSVTSFIDERFGAGARMERAESLRMGVEEVQDKVEAGVRKVQNEVGQAKDNLLFGTREKYHSLMERFPQHRADILGDKIAESDSRSDKLQAEIDRLSLQRNRIESQMASLEVFENGGVPEGMPAGYLQEVMGLGDKYKAMAEDQVRRLEATIGATMDRLSTNLEKRRELRERQAESRHKVDSRQHKLTRLRAELARRTERRSEEIA